VQIQRFLVNLSIFYTLLLPWAAGSPQAADLSSQARPQRAIAIQRQKAEFAAGSLTAAPSWHARKHFKLFSGFSSPNCNHWLL
jgi:hypothetical protein